MEYNHTLGILLSVFAAFFWATNDIFNKRALQKGYEENFILWIRFPLGAVILFPIALLYWDLNKVVFLTTFLWLPTEIVASIFFIKAIKYSPLSIAMPFFAFMPFFSTLGGWIFLNEKIDLKGFLGIFLIFSGSVILTGGNFKTFFTVNRGALYALISAMLFGFNVVVGKIAVVSSNQFFFSWYYCLVMSFGLLPFVKKFQFSFFKEKEFPFIGLLFSLGMVFYSWAYLYTFASYAAAAERLAILLDVLYGKIFFKEKIASALPASILMILGTILLTV